MMYNLNLREVNYALSEALDYVGIDDIMHGKRVAFMSAQIAQHLGWDQQRIDDIIMMGMLHDCGVSSTDVHHHLVTELDWDNAQTHCKNGFILLNKVPIYSKFAKTILYHHTHWTDFSELVDETTKENANMIYMSDRVDALREVLGSETIQEKDEIRKVIENYASTMFSPEFADAFLTVSMSDSFWFYMEADSLYEYFNDWINKGEEEDVNFELLKKIAVMFADIVDAKSTFTNEHTHGVAALGRHLASLLDLPQRSQEQIELAAFFHDLGKLRIADSILNKNGPLNEEERSHMNRHGFDTYMILHKVKGFQEIAKYASMHHETLDGKGYPYQISADQIPMEVRILTVADIFQALVQNRPYREGMSAEEAYTILQELVEDNKIDPSIVEKIAENLDKCYECAMQHNLN